ncbi:MAG: outer membrane lipoprotein-sorting protein [Kiritimatiellia bacterium]
MIALLASCLMATNATARELVANCRAMVPADVELSGRIVLRNRRGIVQAEHAYVLTRSAGATALRVDGEPFAPSAAGAPDAADARPTGILGTDVTWSDLTLDYLWWDDVSFDAEREGESVHGQICAVVVLKRDGRTVRAWIDRKTGALLQAEESVGDRPLRRLWGTRLKKFGERWMANVLEVETVGAGHRTKITIEELK